MLFTESIVIVKKFDFQILKYLYVLSPLEFIYAIFGVMHVRMCVCAYVCVYVSEHDSIYMVHSIQLKFGMHIKGHRRTNPYDLVKVGLIVFYKSSKMNFYSLRPMAS